MSKSKRTKKRQIKDERHFILAMLASGGAGVIFDPTSIQKILFLINEEMANDIGDSYFNFKQGIFGPTDDEILDSLEKLAAEKLVVILPDKRIEKYILNQDGLKKGEAILNSLTPKVRDYFKLITNWGVECSFTDLVRTIFTKYPEWKRGKLF